jgi:hypothetical protein
MPIKVLVFNETDSFMGITILKLKRICQGKMIFTKKKMLFIGLLLSLSCKNAVFADATHALQLLLINKHNGFFSCNLDGIKVSIWEKYCKDPTTIHPIYSKRSKNARKYLDVDNRKIEEILEAGNISDPEVTSMIEAILLGKKLGMIQVQNSRITVLP